MFLIRKRPHTWTGWLCAVWRPQDDLWTEVPRLVTSLQERLSRVCRLILQSEECVLGKYRLNWAIDHAQRVIGDHYWDAMDKLNPNWLEDRFEQVGTACGLDS
jgi:hypothetical protein